MHHPERLKCHDFDAEHPLLPHLQKAPQQERYIRTYLRDLGAEAILEEPHYFDRDYLSEFRGYYATSARGYPNVCRRLHFFSVPLPRRKLRRALGGSQQTLKNLRDAYLGFCVVRPLPTSPFGKTVLRWYPEQTPDFPRVTNSRRRYTCQIAGVSFSVDGLAWQQQDTSVAACATVALWSMLHSSAFTESHAIPTTYEITEAANKTLGYGRRAFPSKGLTADQLGEVIKSMELKPGRIEADVRARELPRNLKPCFSPKRFSPIVCGLLRSGYPILVAGSLWMTDEEGQLKSYEGQHAVCLSGFREPEVDPSPGLGLQDEQLEHVYLHDDNEGPNVRYRVDDFPFQDGQDSSIVILKRSSPGSSTRVGSSSEPRFAIVPSELFVAVHEAIRVDIQALYRRANKLGGLFQKIHERLAASTSGGSTQISTGLSLRFIDLNDYLGDELPETLEQAGHAEELGSTRLQLLEEVPPLSKHMGLIRVSTDGEPVVDFLVDTTEIGPASRCLCHVVFDVRIKPILDRLGELPPKHVEDIGVRVETS